MNRFLADMLIFAVVVIGCAVIKHFPFDPDAALPAITILTVKP